jgi:hypothetical protein
LQAADIQILEDGNSIPPQEVTELNAGMQVVVAINPGASFGVRNSQGRPRYNFLQDALQQWAKNRQGSTQDDWSLIITNSSGTRYFEPTVGWEHFKQRRSIFAQPNPARIQFFRRLIWRR